MQNRIVEIVSDRVHVSLFRGFLKLSRQGAETGRIPLPDIAAVVVRGFGASLSLNAAAKLAELNIPVVLCDARQTPVSVIQSVIQPVTGHHAQGHIIAAQAAAGRPVQKRLWQGLVRGKITAQAQVLRMRGAAYRDLDEIAGRVRSGDPDNSEAMAARRYWPRLMGPVEQDFKRDRSAAGVNAALNYGYTVLYAAAARSVLAAGLHPSLSLHHVSRGEPLRLASDIMEPFRPWVDDAAYECARGWQNGAQSALTAEDKSRLVNVLNLDLEGPYGASPVQTCLDRLCQSLAAVFTGERRTLELPGPPVVMTRANRERV